MANIQFTLAQVERDPFLCGDAIPCCLHGGKQGLCSAMPSSASLCLSVCPLCYGTLSGPSGAERIKEAFLRSTDDDVRCQELEEEEEHHELWRLAAFSLFRRIDREERGGRDK